MLQTLRPYVAASVVALVGPGMIALTPVAAPADVGVARPVALTAGFFETWENVLTTAFGNADTVFTELQSMGTAFWQELATSGNIDLQVLFDAVTFLGGDQANLLNLIATTTLDLDHNLLYVAATGQFDPAYPAPDEAIQALVNSWTSPLSGVLMGAVGPVIAPLVALSNSIGEIVAALEAADLNAVWEGLINVPANVVGGFLNGATLDLTALIPAIVDLDILPFPAGTEVESLSIAFGGLFSSGATVGGLTLAGIGGSILNSVGLDALGASILGDLSLDGVGVGPFGAQTGLLEALTLALSLS